jgi:sialic acid synthase SpsE
MHKDHDAYVMLKSYMFRKEQWKKLIEIVRDSGKELMLLLNDTKAIEFASQFSPGYIELHSVCVNVPRLQSSILKKFGEKTKIVIGVGGCTLYEIDNALRVFSKREVILMFGFQNYPTNYDSVSLEKIRRIQSLYDNDFGYADHTAWNEENNELITLLVASNNMKYIEKHVTNVFGENRCDYSATVSIDTFNKIHSKMKILEKIQGNGSISLNKGEKEYSVYGHMKMAGVASMNMLKGQELKLSDINFCRTSQTTKISQIELLELVGSALTSNLAKGSVFNWQHFNV